MHSVHNLTCCQKFTLSTALCALALFGRGAEAYQSGESGTADNVQSSLPQEATLINPEGTYFATVTANGTGCPAGTWAVSIDPAGETFTLTFSAYETQIDPGALISVRDCQIGVNLHSPQGLSYSVGDFFYSGYAFLDRAGMTATQTAGYYFQGNPLNSTSARTDLQGPYDGTYLYHDQIGIADLVWSPCGTERMLNIPTRIIVKNNGSRTGTGYLNTLAVDGSVSLTFRIYWRTCKP